MPRNRTFCRLALTLAAAVTCSVATAHGPIAPSPPFVAGPEAAPYAGRLNYAHTNPTFRWGWFGAERFDPPVTWHRGYYGDVYRWRRGRLY